MEPLLPALDNLPVFYTVLVSLLVMAGLSGCALYSRVRRRSLPPGFAWLKGLVLLPLWLLALIWTGLVVAMGIFAGGMTGSLLFPLSGLAILPVFALLTWGLYFWIRSRTLADAAVLLLVPACIAGVFALQRLWICEPLARSGLGSGQLCTARLYDHGEGGAIRNQGVAHEWYRLAAEQGEAEAEYQLAEAAHQREQKLAWYTRAADQGHAGAAYRLYWLLEKDDPEVAVQRLQAAAREGHAGAEYRLGVLYRQGHGGMDRDLSRSRELMLRAAEGGHITAMQSLAIAYARDGVLFDNDPALSRHWEQQARERAASKPDIPAFEQYMAWNWERLLLEARARHAHAEAGDADTQLAIGRELLQQAGGDMALVDKAHRWVERAAQSGSVEAQFQLASEYLDDATASEVTREAGRRWLLAAADDGHEAALRKVISAFKEQAYGFPRDLQRSKAYSEVLFAVLKARGVLENQTDWRTSSWEYSDTLAQIRKEASRYLPPDELKQQSDAGDPVAQYHQAKELMQTRYAEGTALMLVSAEAGYPQAQYEMARSYRHRKRTEQEERQAIEWLIAAAESGHRGAMVDLGAIYLRGIKSIGLERNPYRAKRLFEQALADREGDVIYEQKTSRGSWQYTMRTMNNWLAQVPAAVQRLDLEGLQGEQRRRAIEQWYAQEREALQSQPPGPEGAALQQKQLDQLEQQRSVLLTGDSAGSG